MKVFVIDGQQVLVPEESIKQYFTIGQCFKQENGVLVPIDGYIFIDEEGTICDCDNCSNEVEVLLGEDGLPLTANLDFSTMESTYGFIYKNKLQFVDQLEKVE